MKRLLAAALLCLFAVPAVAGMNIRQNADGSTDWVDASGNAFNVGAVYLTVNLADVSNANVSAAVAVPITNGKVTLIQTALHGALATADAQLNFYAGTGLTSGSVSTSNEISNATSPLVITQSGSANGDVDSLTPTTQNAVAQGDVIIITTDGSSGNSIPVTVTITVEPNGT